MKFSEWLEENGLRDSYVDRWIVPCSRASDAAIISLIGWGVEVKEWDEHGVGVVSGELFAKLKNETIDE